MKRKPAKKPSLKRSQLHRPDTCDCVYEVQGMDGVDPWTWAVKKVHATCLAHAHLSGAALRAVIKEEQQRKNFSIGQELLRLLPELEYGEGQVLQVPEDEVFEARLGGEPFVGWSFDERRNLHLTLPPNVRFVPGSIEQAEAACVARFGAGKVTVT